MSRNTQWQLYTCFCEELSYRIHTGLQVFSIPHSTVTQSFVPREVSEPSLHVQNSRTCPVLSCPVLVSSLCPASLFSSSHLSLLVLYPTISLYIISLKKIITTFTLCVCDGRVRVFGFLSVHMEVGWSQVLALDLHLSLRRGLGCSLLHVRLVASNFQSFPCLPPSCCRNAGITDIYYHTPCLRG